MADSVTIQQFLYQHLTLQTVYLGAIEAASKDFTKEDLNWWFEEFEKTIEEKNIQTRDIYNINEIEFAIETIQWLYVVGNKDLKI